MTFHGRVTRVDWAGRKLMVIKNNDEYAFHVSINAVLTRNGDKIALFEISSGDLVRIEYFILQGTRRVRHLNDVNPARMYQN